MAFSGLKHISRVPAERAVDEAERLDNLRDAETRQPISRPRTEFILLRPNSCQSQLIKRPMRQMPGSARTNEMQLCRAHNNRQAP
jgi:hypothetical protein